YITGGSFDVSLTVTTEQGSKTYVEQDAIVVTPLIKILANVVADKSSDKSAVNFVDATDTGDTAVIGRRWTFGDGASASDEESPVHTFDAPGTYTIGLEIITSNGT